jgi:WD40 repeat protein
MPGHVFLSYGRGDRPVAHRIAEQLDAAGFSVWWDRDIDVGVPYDRVIERALADAACVVVLWSQESVESDWVRAEADEGRRRGILVPALVEGVNPPLQFRLLETIDLAQWSQGDDLPSFERFRSAVERLSPPSDWLTRWRDGLQAHGLLHTVPLGPHDGWVSCVRFTGDQDAVSTSGDGVLRSWTLPSGTAKAEARGHHGSIWCCAAAGDYVVTGGADKTVRVWDAKTFAPVQTLEGHQEWVLACTIAPRLGLVATASRDASARLWGIGTWIERAVLVGHRGPVWTAAFTPDADRLITSSDDQTVRVWSVPQGKSQGVLRGHTAPVTACVALPDGQRAISGGYDGELRCWDLQAGVETMRLEGNGEWILSLTATPDGSLAIGGTRSGVVLVWDLARGEVVARLAHHRAPVMSLDFRDSVGLLSGSADKTAALVTLRPFDATV